MSLRVHYEILNQKGTPAFYSDIFANRPTFGFAGRVFISTDTGEIFEDTGTAWTLIADAGAGTTGTLQQVTTNGNTTNQGIVITAGNLGINTSSPGAPLDIHGTGTNAQFNGTGTNNAYLLFQNAGANKWRLGNNYNAGANSFDFYSYNAVGVAASLNGNGSLLLNFNLGIKQSTGINQVSGYSNIATDSGGFFFNTGGANNAYLSLSGLTASRTYTLPDATGTIALTSNLSSYLPLSGGTLTGNLGITKTSAPSKLSILQSSDTLTNGIRIYRSNNADYFENYMSGGFGSLNDTYNFYASFTGGIVAAIDRAGQAYFASNVGIGTSSPTDKLNVVVGSNGNNTRFDGPTSGLIIQTNSTTIDLISYGGTTPAYRQMNFATSATTAMTITTAGNLGIGSTASSNVRMELISGGNTSSSYAAVFYNSSVTTLFQIRDDGYGYLRAASWAYGSDVRIKENINYIENGLNKILLLKPAKFDYIKGVKNNIGWIAQDVQKVIPEAVQQVSDTNDQLTLKSDFIVPYLVKAIQELNEKLERNNIN